MSKRKILVTGGLGHIGSALIRHLSSHNNDIIVVDNLLTQRYCSLFNISGRITFLEKNFEDLTDQELDVDIVVHLAAITDAAGSFKNKDELERVNTLATKEFFERIYDNGKVKLVVFPSSTSVYGKGQSVMIEDEDNISPQSPYAASKIAIEEVLKKLQGPTDYLIYRFGTIYGVTPGMRFHTAINKFCYQAATGQPLTVWRDNYNQYRPYLDVNLAIMAILTGINRLDEMKNQTYNVISQNHRLSDIIEYIKEIKPEAKVNFVDTPLLNQHSYFVDGSKIAQLGFPTFDNLKQEIATTLFSLRGLK